MNAEFSVGLKVTAEKSVFPRSWHFTPRDWKAVALNALNERDRLLGVGRCMLNPNLTTDTQGPEEHVIPKGTGIRWIKLPSGATASDSNGRASAWEGSFLRDGMMGALRPFYVGGKKSVTFIAADGRKVVFRNDPQSGFVIETHDLDVLPKGSNGPGSLRFVLPVVQAPTLNVSRALHKIAYLTLAVVQPDLAFSSAFDQIRQYLSVEMPVYRSYGERFLPGASPGAAIFFHLRGSYLRGNQVGGDAALAVVRIHHGEYVVPLLGSVPDALPGLSWNPDPMPAGKKQVTLEMTYEKIVEETE